MTLTIMLYSTSKYTMLFPLDNDYSPTPDLSAMTSTTGGSPKSNRGKKEKNLRDLLEI